MTERWRKRLEDLDKASPSDEVFRRAAEGPQLPDESIPYPSSGSRVVGGVAALVVFALAISVFVVPALRMNDTAGAPGEAVLPLWPAQTLDEVAEFQADADAAGDWYELVDPSRTASRFATDVMGWEPDRVQVDEIGGFVYPTVAPTNAYGPTTYTESSTMSPSSPFRTFHVAWVCAPNERCPLRGPVTVTVFQPLERGDGKVWMVLDVQSDLIDLTVSGGMVLTDGDEIAAGFQLPGGAELGFGYHVGPGPAEGNCDVTDSVTGATALAVPGVENALFDPVGTALHVDLSPARGDPSCVSPQPGYVFAAMAYEPVGGDPLAGGDVSLIGLSAVPLAFAWDEAPPPTVGPTPTPTASASVGPAEVVWTSYTDPLGWTIDVPAGWQTGSFDDFNGRTTATGSWLSSATPTVVPGDVQEPDSTWPASGEVMIKIWNRQGGPLTLPADDSSFPLSADAVLAPGNSLNSGGWASSFRGDGLEFTITVRAGDNAPSLTDEQDVIVRRMLESIRFEPWSGGEVRHGLIAVLPRADVWPLIEVVHPADGPPYAVSVIAERSFVIGLPANPCEERGHGTTTWETDGELLTATCGDGITASYGADGSPTVGNPATWNDPLTGSVGLVSWDGWVLAPVEG